MCTVASDVNTAIEEITTSTEATSAMGDEANSRCGPRRRCCRGWLASALASMCMAQVVLSTGVWLRPYVWWQFASFSRNDPDTQVTFEIKDGALAYYLIQPRAAQNAARVTASSD